MAVSTRSRAVLLVLAVLVARALGAPSGHAERGMTLNVDCGRHEAPPSTAKER